MPGPGASGQPAGLVPPNTPQKNGAGLNDFIHVLNETWELGLSRNEIWSPITSANETADRVYGQLKRYYYQRLPELRKAIRCFAREANEDQSQIERLHLLYNALKEIDPKKEHEQSSESRVGTPRGTKNALRPDLRTLQTGQSPSSVSRPFAPSSGLLHTARGENGAAYNPTVPDPGSPTDEDDDFTTPPSPTPSSRSAQRRVRETPRVQLGSTVTKRSSENSHSGSSPKHMRTSKGKERSGRIPDLNPPISAPLFKKPSLDMARSYQASPANTSFNTNASSQRTQPNTAMTSFTSDTHEVDVNYPELPRMSSTTLDWIDDEDLLSVEAEAQLTRESARLEEPVQSPRDTLAEFSSTYGRIDEDGILETSLAAEAEYVVSVPPKKPLPRPNSIRQDSSTIKRAHFEQGPSTERSPFYRPREPGHIDFDPKLNRMKSQSRGWSQSPRNVSDDSPSKLPHYIRDIPEQNLFTETLPENLTQFPYFILFICSRLADEHSVSLSQLLYGSNANDALTKSADFLDHLCNNLKISSGSLGDDLKIWSTRKKNFEGYTFKAQINYNINRYGSVFRLQLLPITAKKSCLLQRKFGSDRFLYINVPSFEGSATKPSRFVAKDMPKIEEQWKVWFEREHSFLGRKWRAFHIEPIKKKASRRTDNIWDKRIVMFATQGLGIERSMTIGEMLNWFFPFNIEQNMRQSFCKAYARLDLGLSRTIPTLAFTPSQIIYVKDLKADGTPEDVQHNDNTVVWPNHYPTKAVMNDGCALISVGAALSIWQIIREATNSEEPMPSAFQGRIGGAKGVWMVSEEPSSVDRMKSDIWIQISQSQLKFKPHKEDRSDASAYDIHRLTFGYVKHSYKPVPSELHKSFVPILVDRGVPRDVIANLMVERLNAERDQLVQLLPNPERMYHWVHRQEPSYSTSESPRWQAAMYKSLANTIKHLFESGFIPEQEPYLADCLYRFIKQRQVRMESKLRVPLSRSTFVLGVADPFGVLAPGEIHMAFSSPFVDELTLGRFRALEDVDVLVSRQPALRSSDIQKVRAVKCPQLSHLIDVVVFPTKGEYPLAGKLQGGDYDGDTFWLCWDPAIVKPFKNAPAPFETPDATQYGIKEDKTRLSELIESSDLSTVDSWLRRALNFRMAPSLLGMVTNFLEKQAYQENQVLSDRLVKLCNMHDLLVDAPKQGYMLTWADFRHYTRNVLLCSDPQIPAYKQAMADCEDGKEFGNGDDPREGDYKHKYENVLDYLYFEVVRAHDITTLKIIEEVLSKKDADDRTLQYPYLQLRKAGSDAVQSELDALKKSFKSVEAIWLDHWMSVKSEGYDAVVDKCFKKYCSILPTRTDHPDIKPWVLPYEQPQHSVWEEIRASAFYTLFPKRHKLVWLMAGKQLAKLKGESYPGSTTVVPRIKLIMKPKPPKVPKPEAYESDDDYQSAFEE
ncbi:hypothetical protein N0V90_011853 [Kalmusia sp. IMI 367209]|nr:hypothetical protein N0V90_011853 [Kalmusia sp. IMI 367209]